MDEIDAALDFKNVSIVGHYITVCFEMIQNLILSHIFLLQERTKNAQFIIISLRSNMFELCDNLIGIYKIFNCTKSITINPKIYDKENQPTTSKNPVTEERSNRNTNNDKEKDTELAQSSGSSSAGTSQNSITSEVSQRLAASTSSSQSEINSPNNQSNTTGKVIEESYQTETMEVDN